MIRRTYFKSESDLVPRSDKFSVHGIHRSVDTVLCSKAASQFVHGAPDLLINKVPIHGDLCEQVTRVKCHDGGDAMAVDVGHDACQNIYLCG